MLPDAALINEDPVAIVLLTLELADRVAPPATLSVALNANNGLVPTLLLNVNSLVLTPAGTAMLASYNFTFCTCLFGITAGSAVL